MRILSVEPRCWFELFRAIVALDAAAADADYLRRQGEIDELIELLVTLRKRWLCKVGSELSKSGLGITAFRSEASSVTRCR